MEPFLVTGEVSRTTTFERSMLGQQARSGEWEWDAVLDDQADSAHVPRDKVSL